MDKTKILFVCMGNICRSPAAEGIFKQMATDKQLDDRLEIDSAGTHGYHRGELPDDRMRAHASRRGYNLTSRSRPVSDADFEHFDYIVAMDDRNIADLKSLAPDEESLRKIVRMTDFCQRLTADHVPDPYYGGAQGFELVLDILEDACDGLLRHLQQER